MGLKFRDYEIITTAERYEQYLESVGTLTTFDTETTGLERDCLLLGISLYDNVSPPVFVSTDYFYEGVSLTDIRRISNKYFHKISGIAHNAKFDLGIFKSNGIVDVDLYCDTSAMCHIWNPDCLKKLETRVKEDLGVQKSTFEEYIGMKWDKIDWQKHSKDGTITLDMLGKYACEDVFYTMRLFEHYAELFDDSLWKVLLEIETPLCYVLRDINHVGVNINVPILQDMEVEIGIGMNELTKDIYEKAGAVFNLNSPTQKAEILFDKLKYPCTKATKTGNRSTDKYVLEDLADQGYPIAQALVTYSSLKTLDSSFIRAIPKFLDDDGRLRCNFNAAGTSTGRFSSSKPNLQNQPNNTDYPVRAAFIPSAGNKLLGADYSQIELRIMAHCAQDAKLMDAFWAGEDIHARVARDLGIPRKGAKVINFGVLYGMGPDKLARTLGISVAEAKSIVSGYESTYRGFSRWKTATERFAENHKYVVNIFGRIRRLPDAANPRNRQAYYGALRRAVNTVIQGSAADLMKIAMINVNQAFQREQLNADMLLTVHDELLIDCPEIVVVQGYELLVREMEGAIKLTVPIIADGKICDNWSQMKDDDYLNPIEQYRFNPALLTSILL